MNKYNDLMIYIHIPFCISKCRYCDFLSFVHDDDCKRAYIEALLNEIRIESKKYAGDVVSSIFIGGGTPSSIAPEHIKMIMDTVNESFTLADEGAECTIECNPGTVSSDGLLMYQESGINRISFGLQSTDDAMLKKLGRIHSYKDFGMSLEMAMKAGFSNINVDVMLGLPGQEINDAKNDIKRVCECGVTHISAYSLIIEEGTPFFDLYNGTRKIPKDMMLPDEDAEREIYHMCQGVLAEHGYRQYEISNFARQGFECRHNVGYWLRRNYVGFGLGAASLYAERRWNNTSNIKMYIDIWQKDDPLKDDSIGKCRENAEVIDVSDQMEETMFLGLRLVSGVEKTGFKKTFGKDIYEIYQYRIHTEKMIKDGLLIDDGNYIKLTQRGLDLANTVMAGYIID